MRRVSVIEIFTLLLVLAAGCSERREPVYPLNLRVYYTCDTHGHLYPCDCDTGKDGGVARRATVLAARSDDSLLVDAGDVTGGARDWELLEFEYLLRAYELLGYDAVNLGHREAAFSLKQLRAFSARCDLLISANLVDIEAREVVPPWRVATLSDGFKVGLLGVMDDTLAPDEWGEGLMLIPPDVAIAQVLPELRKKVDIVVLLAFADDENLMYLADSFPEIQLIVGGRIAQTMNEPLRVNDSLIAGITDKGKTIGTLTVELQATGISAYSNAIVPLNYKVPDESRTAALLAEYDRKLKKRAMQDRRSLIDESEGLTTINGSEPAAEKQKEQP